MKSCFIHPHLCPPSSRSERLRRGGGLSFFGDAPEARNHSKEMDDIERENLRLTTRRMDLSVVAEKVCAVHGVNSGELRSGSRWAA
ncbi:MAG: hypothetical protein B6I32_06395 [Desulfobacterium sp. 4572_20]|nr:hypothetical protein [Deltaproteobacteria bacterium]OQY15650.1 MAG: hypothetical protein B6I32_06395 [Desulfobacterium sp. 4572_20]